MFVSDLELVVGIGFELESELESNVNGRYSISKLFVRSIKL